MDTSRVALALARSRIMGARYPYYLLVDSREGQLKEAEVSRVAPSSQPVHQNIKYGFVCERIPHITSSVVANNAEIDVIWEKWRTKVSPLLEDFNLLVRKTWLEWEVPRVSDSTWTDSVKVKHRALMDALLNRQAEIDASIAAKAEFEYFYDRPYEDRKRVRVAGPFTVESLSPHRTLGRRKGTAG
jgi:adenine-specific DNA-methyltransferase